MCGIYLSNLDEDIDSVKNNLEQIKFRGPNYTRVEKTNDIIIGHLRLAILDLDERSNQPMVYNDLYLVFNGEIYNFKDIRSELIENGYSFDTTSDTEVLLKGYDCWGEDVVSKLNGMFAFYIYNKRTNFLFCSRDRLGVKPFYYFWDGGQLQICSQLRPIANGKEIDPESISIYLQCGWIPSPFSIYKNVYKLKPGHNLLINLNTNKLTLKKYWDLSYQPKIKDINYDDALSELKELLEDAVRIRLNSDVPLGSFLSGGIDSALVSSIASKISENKINTFTIGFDNPVYDESRVSRQYASILRTNHIETIVKPQDFQNIIKTFFKVYDEPFADSSALPSLVLNKMAKKHVTVALSGDGGDESFLGYSFFPKLLFKKKLLLLPTIVRKGLKLILPQEIHNRRIRSLNNLLKIKNENDLLKSLFIDQENLSRNDNHNWFKKHYNKYLRFDKHILMKASTLTTKFWLENDSNVKVDRASMAFSTEIRSPFLDYRVIEFARQLPMKYKYDNKNQKRILRDILEDYIPRNIFEGPKKGFSIPLSDWILNDLKDEFSTNLKDEIIEEIPYLNTKKFKIMYNAHMKAKEDNSVYIWRVYVLAKWLVNNGYICSKFN